MDLRPHPSQNSFSARLAFRSSLACERLLRLGSRSSQRHQQSAAQRRTAAGPWKATVGAVAGVCVLHTAAVLLLALLGMRRGGEEEEL